MKKTVLISACLGILISICICADFMKTEETISESVVRLHVRANSDSAIDQKLKLKVRDRILKETEQLFSEQDNIEDVRNIINENIDIIKKVAKDEIKENGYSYNVSVQYGKSDFPTKSYGDICLPAGTYEALIVNIGEGKGQNWWCVLFPPLCFVNETCVEVPVKSGEVIEKNIGTKNYELLQGKKPKIKFKLYEWWVNR